MSSPSEPPDSAKPRSPTIFLQIKRFWSMLDIWSYNGSTSVLHWPWSDGLLHMAGYGTIFRMLSETPVLRWPLPNRKSSWMIPQSPFRTVRSPHCAQSISSCNGVSNNIARLLNTLENKQCKLTFRQPKWSIASIWFTYKSLCGYRSHCVFTVCDRKMYM